MAVNKKQTTASKRGQTGSRLTIRPDKETSQNRARNYVQLNKMPGFLLKLQRFNFFFFYFLFSHN